MTGLIDPASLCPAGYGMGLLERWDFAEVISLYRSVCRALPKAQKTFVYEPQGESLDHVTEGRGDLIGIRFNKTDHIVGACLIAYPARSQESFGLAQEVGGGFGKVSILRSYVVHPGHRARGIGETLVKAWLNLSGRAGRSLCITEVLPHNMSSRVVFHRCGLHHTHDAIHPYDGEPVMIFSRNFHTGGIVSRSTRAFKWESQ